MALAAASAEPAAAAASAVAAADDSLQLVTVTAKNQCRFCQQLFLLVRFLPVAGPTTSTSGGWVNQGYFVLKRNQVKKVLATQASSYQLYAYCSRTDGGGWIEWKGSLLKPVAVPVPGSSSSPPQCTDIPFVQRQLPQATAAAATAALVLRCSRTAGLVGPPVRANAAGVSAAAAAPAAASAGSAAAAAADGSRGGAGSNSSGGREQDLLEGEASAVVAAADTAAAAAAAGAGAEDEAVHAAGQAPGSVSGVASSGPQLPAVAGPSGTALPPGWVPFAVKNSCSRCGAARVVVRYRPLFGAVASAKVAPGTDYASSGWFQVPLGQAVPVAAVARGGRVFVHAQCSAGGTGRRWAGPMPFSFSDDAYGCSRGTDLTAVALAFLPGDPSAPVYELTCPEGCGVLPAPMSGVSAWPSRCVGATSCSVACDVTHVGGPMTATCNSNSNTWLIAGSSCQPRTINFCPDSSLRDDVACRSGFPTFFGCPCLRNSSAGVEPGCRRLGVCTASGCSPCTAQEAPTCPVGYTCARALGDCVPTEQLKR